MTKTNYFYRRPTPRPGLRLDHRRNIHRLQPLNYRPLVIGYDDREAGLAELARRLGMDLGA